MKQGTRFLNSQFAAAIPKSGGLITTIALKVGCNYHTARKRIDASPELRLLYEAEREGINDVAESQIITAIRAGDIDSAWKWLRAHRKDEFSEKQSLALTGENGGKLEIVVTYADENKRNPPEST